MSPHGNDFGFSEAGCRADEATAGAPPDKPEAKPDGAASKKDPMKRIGTKSGSVRDRSRKQNAEDRARQKAEDQKKAEDEKKATGFSPAAACGSNGSQPARAATKSSDGCTFAEPNASSLATACGSNTRQPELQPALAMVAPEEVPLEASSSSAAELSQMSALDQEAALAAELAEYEEMEVSMRDL